MEIAKGNIKNRIMTSLYILCVRNLCCVILIVRSTNYFVFIYPLFSPPFSSDFLFLFVKNLKSTPSINNSFVLFLPQFFSDNMNATVSQTLCTHCWYSIDGIENLALAYSHVSF